MYIRALLFLVGASFLSQSTLAAPQAVVDKPKFWVFFADKPATSGKEAQPLAIDSRTLERRRLRGTDTGAWLDRPVSASYLSQVREIAGEVIVVSRWLNAVSVRTDETGIEQIRMLPFVEGVREVGALTRPERPEGPLPERIAIAKTGALDYGPSRRQLAFVNAIRPLEEEVNGAGVRIGFLDTQFDFSHPALRHIRDSGRLIEVRDFTGPNQEVYGRDQNNYHGLNVSSIAVGYDPGNLIGPAYGAEVLAATTEFAPTETNQEEDNLVAGLEWMESQGVDVINISLGYTTFDAGQRSYTQEEMDGDTGITTIAADIAASLGVVIVTSAGNDGSSSWGIIGTPADGDSVIAIGAATPDSARASFSSVGPTADGRIKPDVSAMGTSVVVAVPNGGYLTGSGTSFSSPMVAGVVAQLLQVNPALEPMEVLEILRLTADRSESPTNQLGWGIVNSFAAVEEARMRAQNLPDVALIRTAYPNPFTDEVRFEMVSPLSPATGRLTLYDTMGRRLDVIFDGELEPGTNVIHYRPQSLASGMYFYHFETGEDSAVGALYYVR